MIEDPYKDLAERYDWMKLSNLTRDEFFRKLFADHSVKTVLDCACGTGRDIILFDSFGCDVHGSDLSESMLAQAHKNLSEANLDISLKKADFRNLSEHYTPHFDAVVCLSNAINEPLEDSETLKAVRSMKAILRDGGILVFDQAQTDATMKKPHRFDPIANERDYSRLFVVDYFENKMEVHIFDFIHTESERDFKHNSFYVRIRLKDSWESILREAEFKKVEYFGDWRFSPYDKEQSRRLIAVAHK
jgi:glycine/sarcosine N-methyltransferase